jgi:hypothetical protein
MRIDFSHFYIQTIGVTSTPPVLDNSLHLPALSSCAESTAALESSSGSTLLSHLSSTAMLPYKGSKILTSVCSGSGCASAAHLPDLLCTSQRCCTDLCPATVLMSIVFSLQLSRLPSKCLAIICSRRRLGHHRPAAGRRSREGGPRPAWRRFGEGPRQASPWAGSPGSACLPSPVPAPAHPHSR